MGHKDDKRKKKTKKKKKKTKTNKKTRQKKKNSGRHDNRDNLLATLLDLHRNSYPVCSNPVHLRDRYQKNK